MSRLIEVGVKPAADIGERKKLQPLAYRSLAGLSKKIRDLAVIHINATPSGGGVAEILKSAVPLERHFGLKSRWFVFEAPLRFFAITKKIHNLLQGKPGSLTEDEKNFYLAVNSELGKDFKRRFRRLNRAVVVVHDPQPLPLISFIPKNFFPVLRLHIDLLTPNASALEFLKPFISAYPQMILSSKDYRASFPWFKKSKIKIIAPAIDPFSEKNKPMNPDVAKLILEQFGINCTKPIITQVSRFDPWKDPLGVIRAYYLAKNTLPDLELVLAGFFFAKDDPEAISVFKEVKKHARGDPDIYLFADTRKLKNVVNDTLMNALYTASSLIIQKSIREGFGLTITEAMWKGRAVIAGTTSGSLLQIKNGKNGILVSSPEEAAKAIVRLIKNKALRERLGKAARESVKRRFLMLRFVLNNTKLYLAAFKKHGIRH